MSAAQQNRDSGENPPATATKDFVHLPIDEVDVYDRNPRMTPNPKRREIKSSILAGGGLSTPLAVTKKPGSKQFTIQQGGNTRLEVLKELRRESPAEDSRFDTVPAIIMPYTSELDLAALHDRENNCRGDLLFVERAQAKMHQYELFCRERPDAEHNDRSFLAYMSESYGEKIDKNLLSRMRYTIEELLPSIPNCLIYGGMRDASVRDLIKFRNLVGEVWVKSGAGTAEQFRSVFLAHLSRMDTKLGQEFLPEEGEAHVFPIKTIAVDFSALKMMIQNEIDRSDGVDAGYQRIGLWLNAALNQRSRINYHRQVASSEPLGWFPQAAPKPESRNNDRRGGSVVSLSKAGPAASQGIGQTEIEVPKGPAAMPLSAPNCETPEPKIARPRPSIAELRDQAARLALSLAQRNGFVGLIQATPDFGMGYIVLDVFPDGFEMKPADERKRLSAVWWALAMCSGSTALDNVTVDERLPQESFLGLSLRDEQMELIYRYLDTPDLGAAIRLWSVLSSEDWADFLALFSLLPQLIGKAQVDG